MNHCGTLLDLLAEFRLKANLDKCFTMLAISGRDHRKVTACWMKRTDEGWCLCFPRRGGSPAVISLRRTIPYLGIQASFGAAAQSFHGLFFEIADHLAGCRWLRGLFEKNLVESGQRDVAEFINETLEWCRSPLISMSWERRYNAVDECLCAHGCARFLC